MYLYADITRYRYILYLVVVVILSILIFKNSIHNEIYMLKGIIGILISVSALIFINYCTGYVKEKKLYIVQIFLIISIFLLIIKFMDLYDLSLFGSFKGYEIADILDNEYFMTNITLGIIFMFTATEKWNRKQIIIFFLINICLTILVRVFYTVDLIKTVEVVTLFFVMRAVLDFLCFKFTKKLDFKFKNEINILRVFLFIDFFTIIIDYIIYYNVGHINNTFSIIADVMRGGLLTIFSISACEKLLTSTYKGIFNDTIDINKKLIESNKELENQTIQLEKIREDLKNEELLYKHFLKLVPIPLAIINVDNKRINYCNRSFLNLTNSNIKSVINNVIDNIIKIEYDDLRDLRLGINKIYRGKYNYGNTIKDLNIIPLELQNAENSVILVVEDVTEKRKIEKIRNAIIDKEINEKIKKDFLSNISHDLKTPINVISSAAQLNSVYADNENNESILEYISISKKNLQTLIHLTDNLMKFEGEAKIHLLPVIVKDNVVLFLKEKISSLIKYAETKGVNLSVVSEEEVILLKYDKEFLERILLNLISNAMKFTSVGGIVTVKCYMNKENVFIDIEDNGRGIKQEFIESAFEKYSMQYEIEDKNKDGSGIGLFVVYSLMRLQGGNVMVESQEGKGTKFTLVFKRN